MSLLTPIQTNEATSELQRSLQSSQLKLAEAPNFLQATVDLRHHRVPLCKRTAAERSMNILLQKKGTLSYVKGLSGWTTRREKARVFGTGLEALFFCFNRRITNMQILAEFVDARMNFILPVTDLRGD